MGLEQENLEPAEPSAEEAGAQAEELEKLKAETAELNDRLLRQYAEFDNFRKRTAKEKLEITNYTKVQCIQEMLGAVDNFERALSMECQDPEYKKGMEMIFGQMAETVKKLGAEEIPAEGAPFDPNFHEAIQQVEDESFGENTVCRVLQKGYRLGDKVIRPARVVVANP